MKLTATIQVSVDGVLQGNGGLHEIDHRTGFERGGAEQTAWSTSSTCWCARWSGSVGVRSTRGTWSAWTLEKNLATLCRIGAAVFVVQVSGGL